MRYLIYHRLEIGVRCAGFQEGDPLGQTPPWWLDPETTEIIEEDPDPVTLRPCDFDRLRLTVFFPATTTM
jgi:hypothetical protein